MNEHDSEKLAATLEAMGYAACDDPYDADVVVMNTCSIREHADKRFFGMLGQFKRRKKADPDFIMCVCGCMPQQKRIVDRIKEQFSWVDIIFGTHTIDEFRSLLEKRLTTGKKQVAILKDTEDLPSETASKRLHSHKALINITYGCNNYCTYCIVPYTRGREKSRTLRSVKQEAIELAGDGVKEIMLLGQNVNSFRDPEGATFADLIRALDKIEGLERLRFMTSHPKDISDDLISCYAECSKLSNHIHLPVQSGSDEILKRMNRHYDRARYMEIIRKLREASPEIAITTDIIVGFPGETEEDFDRTVSLAREVGYDAAFTFIYSPREGTPATRFDEQLTYDEKHERLERLNAVINECSLRKNKELEGKTVDVLVDGTSRKDENFYTGRTDGFKLVNFYSEKTEDEIVGTIARVKITESKTFSLNGKEV